VQTTDDINWTLTSSEAQEKGEKEVVDCSVEGFDEIYRQGIGRKLMFPVELQGGTNGEQGVDSPFNWGVAELFVTTIPFDEPEVDDASHETSESPLPLYNSLRIAVDHSS
jgi:hypothetical protein